MESVSVNERDEGALKHLRGEVTRVWPNNI